MAMHLITSAVAVAGALVLCACARHEVVTVGANSSSAPALFAHVEEAVAFQRGYFADGEMGSLADHHLVAAEPDREVAAQLMATLAESRWESAKAPQFEGGVYPCGGNYLVLHLRDERHVILEIESWSGSGSVLVTGPTGDRGWFMLDDSIRRAVFG